MSCDRASVDHSANTDTYRLLVAAEWLSGLFIAPLSQQQVMDINAVPGKNALHWIGAQLGAPAVAQQLCHILEQETPENLTVQLQRRYTALFEGIFRNRAVMPYESAWCGNGPTLGEQSVAEMNAILRDLNVHVSSDCCEPADHLAIELAALVAALGSDRYSIAADLVRRLQSWSPAFVEALERQDLEGFYAGAGELLLALLRTAQPVLLMTGHAATSANEQCEGELA
jgi:TorA-specific chaperone